MKELFKSVVPLLFILLFTYAAVSKLLDFDRFRSQLYLQPFPQGMSDLLVYVLPFTELVLALLLCFNRSRLAGLVLSTCLMAFSLLTSRSSCCTTGVMSPVPAAESLAICPGRRTWPLTGPLSSPALPGSACTSPIKKEPDN
jgi:hypothetical protein